MCEFKFTLTCSVKIREPSSFPGMKLAIIRWRFLKTAVLLRLKSLNFFHHQINIAKILEEKTFPLSVVQQLFILLHTYTLC